jgi:predicted DNA-binding transcriptional regulator YafY
VRGDRLLSLVLLLQARPCATAPDLAARLGVSVRTVLRDVSALSSAGIPVYAERGRGGGIRLLDTYRAGLAHLSRAEGTGLAVGQSRLAGELGLGDALDTAVEKLLGAGGQALRGGLTQGRRHVLVDVDPWMRSGSSVPLLPAIHDGLLRGRCLALDYTDSSGVRGRRVVAPAGLVAKAGTWYLVTADLSLVRVSRVRACEVLPDPAVLPADFDLDAAWALLRSRVEVRPQRLDVVVTVSPPAVALVRRVLARHVSPGASDDPTTVRLAFNGVEHAVGSLLGFGARVEVLAPQAVRTAMRTAAQAVADLYATRPGPAARSAG